MLEYSTSIRGTQVLSLPGTRAWALGRSVGRAATRLRAVAVLLLVAAACTSPSTPRQSAGAPPRESSAASAGQGSPDARAAAVVPGAFEGGRGAALGYPAQIALLLPLSGRQQAAGVAVRDGFMAALLQEDAGRRPVVNVYDTSALGAADAYARALSEGAQFVVGPLTKEDVQTVADSGTVSVPTLGLNSLPESALPPGLLFQFSLDPEDEARQVARRIVADGRTHGVALLPDNEWGQRVYRAFSAEFAVAGGTLLGQTFYDTAARDYSQPITRLLLIDQSRARASALGTALGTRLEFEPRARSDAQFIFMGAQPQQGRSLRPALLFHLSQDLPVYATSDVFEPDSNANADLDGVMFPDMPWVIAPDATANNFRAALSSYWPARSRGRGRLYAFGFDAYLLIPALRSARPTEIPVGGLTGRLLLDERGRVRRELNWAQVENGRPRPLTVITSGLSRP